MSYPSFHAIGVNISTTTQLTVSDILFFSHRIITYAALFLRLQRHLANKRFFLITQYSLFLFFSFFHQMIFCCLSHSSLCINRISIHIINNGIVSIFQHFSYFTIEITHLPNHWIFNINSEYFV